MMLSKGGSERGGCRFENHLVLCKMHADCRLVTTKLLTRRKIERRALPWGIFSSWGSLCATVFCELCTSAEARALSFSVLRASCVHIAYRYYFASRTVKIDRLPSSKVRLEEDYAYTPFFCSFAAWHGKTMTQTDDFSRLENFIKKKCQLNILLHLYAVSLLTPPWFPRGCLQRF